MKNFAVKMNKVGKEYFLKQENPSLIKSLLTKDQRKKFWALKKITLSIKKGEHVGIVGPNGAGKTTLLKIISGISQPSTGKIQTQGKIVSIMNLEAGFHPELSGKENIMLNGMLVGLTKDQIRDKYEDIIRFANIGSFINEPFYTYSDGMKFRLAFSLAVASRCDILILDEIFMSGDQDFQEKTFNVLKKIQKSNNITTIFTAHLAVLVWAFSDVFYMLDKGKMRKLSKKKMLSMVEQQNKGWQERTSRK